jgi:hypothetical protein
MATVVEFTPQNPMTVRVEKHVSARVALLALLGALALIAAGAQVGRRALARDAFALLGCKPERGVCRVFNSWTGDIELRPLPPDPAVIVPAEAAKEREEKANG